MKNELSCEEVTLLLPKIADGEIDYNDAPDVFEHLADCEKCSNELLLFDIIDVNIPKKSIKPSTKTEYKIPMPFLIAAGLAASILIIISFTVSTPSTTNENSEIEVVEIIPETDTKSKIYIIKDKGKRKRVNALELKKLMPEQKIQEIEGAVPVGNKD